MATASLGRLVRRLRQAAEADRLGGLPDPDNPACQVHVYPR